MKRHKLFFFLLVMLPYILEAQSYHFSQFFSTPLLTNPANTGLIDGPYRVASNLRSQGKSAPNSFFTGYVSGDLSVLKNSLPSSHKAGAGMFFMTIVILELTSRMLPVDLKMSRHEFSADYTRSS